MPTAARLVAALSIALIAWIVTFQVIEGLPDHANLGNLMPMSVLMGAFCGWTILGRRADFGRMGAVNGIGIGLSTVAMTIFWTLFIVAGKEALRLSMARRFDGPMEAIYSMFPTMGEYGLLLLTQTILIALIGGGAIAGVLAHLAGKHWR